MKLFSGIKYVLLTTSIIVCFTACKSSYSIDPDSSAEYTPKPNGSLADISFVVPPHIIKLESNYYLRYQIDVSNENIALVRIVYTQIKDNKAYYFFSIPISHTEFGREVLRPLSNDGFTEYAKKDAVYWLNEDGSSVKLEIKSYSKD